MAEATVEAPRGNFDPAKSPAGPHKLDDSFVDLFRSPEEIAARKAKDAPAAPAKPADKPAEKPAETTTLKVEPEAKVVDPLGFEPAKKPDEKKVDPAPGSKEFNWNALKTKAETAERRVAELEAKLSSKSATEDPDFEAKLSALQKERDDLSNRLRQVALEQHPEFVNRFKNGFERISAQIKTIVGENGEAAAKLILANPSDASSQQLEDIIGQLSPLKQGQVYALITKAGELDMERRAALADAPTRLRQLQDSQQETMKAAIANEEKMFRSTLEVAVPTLEVFQKREGDTEEVKQWNAEVDNALNYAQNLFMGKTDTKELAKAAIWATAGPRYQRAFRAQMNLVASLQATIEKLSASGPKVDPGTPSATPTTDESYLDMFKRKLKEG